jgi:type IV secretory pathway VirB6-like protein
MMMEIEKSDAWQRHQLAAVEPMQRDLARYTQPVIRVVGLCGVAYLASWAVVIVLGAGAMAIVVVAAMSAAVLVLGAPVFVLAVGVEQYFRGRLARISG